MRTRLIIIGLVLLTFCAAYFVPAMAQEQKDQMMKKDPVKKEDPVMKKNAMENKELPTAVMNAFKKDYPNASITGTWTEMQGDKTVYDVRTMQNKKAMTMVYDQDGKLIETKEKIETTALPADVTKSVQTSYPKCTIERAEKIMLGQTIQYGVMLNQDGQTYSLVYSPEGKMIQSQKMAKPEMKEKMGKPTGY